jgi:hypothetical protein
MTLGSNRSLLTQVLKVHFSFCLALAPLLIPFQPMFKEPQLECPFAFIMLSG